MHATGTSRPSVGLGDEVDRAYLVGGTLAILVILVGLSVSMNALNLDVIAAIITFLLLVAISSPLFRWISTKDGDPKLFAILFGGLMLKFLFSMVRYFVIYKIYNGQADSGMYDEAGRVFAQRFRAGIPIHPLPRVKNYTVEVQRVADITGVVDLVVGASSYALFFVFSWFCYMGQVLMIRALRVALPEADHRRYAVLMVLMPSLLFWPSSIGKESVMILILGAVSYGAALLLAPRPRLHGIPIFIAALGGAIYLRPHVALIAIAAMIGSVGLSSVTKGTRDGQLTAAGRSIRFIALGALLVGASVASTATSALVNTGNTEVAKGSGNVDAAQALNQTLARTAVGNSEFSPITATNPIKLPGAIFTVLFRPLPFEAHSLNGLIASAEGLLLLGLFWGSRKRLSQFRKLAITRTYLVFVVAYSLTFIVAFSFVANFGILARQRTQMLPFVLVLLALPKPPPKEPEPELDRRRVTLPG